MKDKNPPQPDITRTITKILDDARVHVFKTHSSYNTKEADKWSVMVQAEAVHKLVTLYNDNIAQITENVKVGSKRKAYINVRESLKNTRNIQATLKYIETKLKELSQ